MPSLQYEWHPGLLPAWIIAFFLPVNVPAISIGCSISSTLLCQIILCYCCVSLNGCHVSIQKWLPVCLQEISEALTPQGRVQPAGILAGMRGVIVKSLLWGSDTEKFRRHDDMASYNQPFIWAGNFIFGDI